MTKERSLVLIALFAALIAALGLIPKINLASGVPITAQGLGVMLCGTVLGAKRGFLAVALFVVLTLIGLPLLAGGRGGIGLMATGSAGYIVGFPFAAFAAGFIVEKWSGNLTLGATLGSIFGAILVMTVFGIIGMSITLNVTLPVATGYAMPFIPGDIAKAIVAGFVTNALYKARPAAVLSRA